MRILYIASGIPVPGTLGGSTHTLEVARGLAARGHTLHVVACRREGAFEPGALVRPVSAHFEQFVLHQLDIPKPLSLLAASVIMRLARAIRPDVIMERYYNFAGAGVFVARHLHLPLLLEVNALIVDPPQVFKRRLDDALGGPLRRWAVAQCLAADAIVTPLHTTVPAATPRSKIVELPWGAAVERFQTLADPAAPHPPRVVFLGSFRAWHGVLDGVRAALLLLERGVAAEFVFIGDGPERAAAERLAAPRAAHFTFTGPVAYDQVPPLLAGASVGIAPFNTAPHPALRAAGFFWSPLKIYEYMAAGLPVVTANIPPLNEIIREGSEGALFHEGDPGSLADALTRVLRSPAEARAMGQRARERVVARYSWARHCEALEQILSGLTHSAHQR